MFRSFRTSNQGEPLLPERIGEHVPYVGKNGPARARAGGYLGHATSLLDLPVVDDAPVEAAAKIPPVPLAKRIQPPPERPRGRIALQPHAEPFEECIEVHLVREPHAPAPQAEPIHLVPHFLSVEVEDVAMPFDLHSTGALLAEYEVRLVGFPQRVRFVVESQRALRQGATRPPLESCQRGADRLGGREVGDR